ncbi:MAG: hypothetical protein JWQ35_2792 [Bacteriovoracaceae bacterium]|nr:hypothetical protein [Bacteriovoracaceae bacterium]
MSRLTRVFVLLMILVVGRLCYLSEPYGVSVDESTYLSMAEVLHHGGTLYKDVVDRKPPALIWTYQLIGDLFGSWNIHAVHFVFFLILLGLLGFCILIVRELRGGSTAILLSAGLYALFSSCFPREVLSANAEYPMTLFLAGAIFLLFKSAEKKRYLFVFISFCLAAISTLFKQYGALIFAFVYLSFSIVELRQNAMSFKTQVKALFVGILGLGFVYGLVCFYFVQKGAFKEFIYYFGVDGFKYIAQSRTLENRDTSAWIAILGMLVSWPALWWGASKSVGIFRRDPKGISLICGAVGALITAFLSGRYYTHYFVPLIWFLSILSAIGLEQVFREKKKTIIILSLLPFCFYVFFNFDREALSHKWSFTKQKQKELINVGSWIKDHTDPTDRIVVWGMASQLYLLSERGSGTRFVFSDFVSGRQPGYKSDISVPLPNAMEEFLTDLEKQKPKVIIDTSSASMNDYQWFPFTRFSLLKSYVNLYYEKSAVVDAVEIWLRK